MLDSARTSADWSSTADLLEPAGDTTLLIGDADVESQKESVNARSGPTIRHFATLGILEVLGFGMTYSVSRPAFLSAFTTGHPNSKSAKVSTTATATPTSLTSVQPSVTQGFKTPAPSEINVINPDDPTKTAIQQAAGSMTIIVTRSV
jgi:hypothetical protein